MNFIKEGNKVWWYDPEDKSSGIYIIVEIKTDKQDPTLYDDTVILISNETSQAEVSACELSSIETHCQGIAELVERATKIAKNEGWSVIDNCQDHTRLDLEFYFDSRHGSENYISILCNSGSVSEFLQKVEDRYEAFDPSYEAYMWLGNDGHGQNGAPYDMQDVLDDMKEFESNLYLLLGQFYYQLQGYKLAKSTRSDRVNEQIDRLHKQAVMNIKIVLKKLAKLTGSRSFYWTELTSGRNPGLLFANDHCCNFVWPYCISVNETFSDFDIQFTKLVPTPVNLNCRGFRVNELSSILRELESYYRLLEGSQE